MFQVTQTLPQAGFSLAVPRARLIYQLSAAALCLGACTLAPAQSTPSGALAGKLTDLHSAPLAGVTVILRNQTTGAETRTITAQNGSYRFATLPAGQYIIEAESTQLGQGLLQGIQINPGHESRVQAAMQLSTSPILAIKTPQLPPPAIPPPATSAPNLNDLVIALSKDFSQPSPSTADTTPLQSIAPQSAPSFQPINQPIPTTPKPQPPPTTAPALNAMLEAAPFQQLPLATLHVAVPASPLFRAPALTAICSSMFAMTAGTARAVHATTNLPALSTVEVASQQADPEASAVTTVVSGVDLQSLPSNGRSWQDFVIDTPASSAEAGSAQASLRGTVDDVPATTIDGASNVLAFGGNSTSASQDDSGVSTSSEGWSGGNGVPLSSSAIRSVRTVAGNVEVDGAHASGGGMNIETERGANVLHGQGFFFNRQNNWGAQNPLTQWLQNTGTVTAPIFTSSPYTPSDHEITWGIGLGSRIRRDKLFWFGAFDGYQRNNPGVAMARNAAQLFVPLEPTSPQIVNLSARLAENQNQAYNDYLGLPGTTYPSSGLMQLANLLGPAPRSATQWQGFLRLDWKATERQSFALEATTANWNSLGGGLTRASETNGNHSFGSSRASQQWILARWQAYITSNLLAVTQASVGREILSSQPTVPSTLEQGFLKNNVWGQLPQVNIDSSHGFTIGNPSRFGQGSYPDERLYHAQEALDWVRNGVLVKAGIEFAHNSDFTSLLRNQTGTYSYSNVQNFISDALAFEKFGLTNLLNYQNPHNCNPAGTALGSLPCYSYYSQTIGPTNWNLSTNDLAAYVTAQWQPARRLVLSAGLRWEREQLPPPLPALANPDLPLTARLPNLGNQWGPRIGLAFGGTKSKWPLLRLAYGMYFGRIRNATLLTAITQTGSLKGDLNFFMRPTDGLNHTTGTGDAPPFPYVLAGQPSSVVTPGAVEFAPNFRNSEIHQGLASIEKSLPGRVMVTVASMVSLGRRLPIAADTNFDPTVNPQTITYNVIDKTGTGPIKTSQVTVPYYALWPAASCPNGALLSIAGQCGRLNPHYQQITELKSRANSTYEAAMIKISRYGTRGLSFYAHYTYSHAMDWNPNETTSVTGSDMLDPANFSPEYGVGNLDVRHSAGLMLVLHTPWKLSGIAGRLGNGWMLSGTSQFRTGLPYSMRTAGSIPTEYDTLSANPIVLGLGPGMNGSGGDNRVYGVARNAFRYPYTWKADMRLGKTLKLGETRQLDLLAETYNLFNHQNVTSIDTTGYDIASGSAGARPTLTYLTLGTTGTDATTAAFGKPRTINATNYYRQRQFQFGVRFRF